MKQNRPYPVLSVSHKAERSVLAGHPWIYDTEIRQADGSPLPANGSLVDVTTEGGKYLGTGFFSLHSKIRIRLISRNANDRFDAAFWERRVRYAWAYRKTVMGSDTGCCRLIFGESDQFPGLTVDRFEDILVTQTLSYGMELQKPVIFPLLVKASHHKAPVMVQAPCFRKKMLIFPYFFDIKSTLIYAHFKESRHFNGLMAFKNSKHVQI